MPHVAITPSSSRIRWANLACRDTGAADRSLPPFVFLHGLTFDRRSWDAVLEALPPNRRAIAFDLPGHGGSPSLGEHGLTPVVEAIHDAIADAGAEPPIVVGHSIGGAIAAIYAATYPASGVVSVEAPIRVESFATRLSALAPLLTGPRFAEVWAGFRASWRMDLVPAPARELLARSERPAQELVLAYQADLLERPLDEVLRWREDGLARLRSNGTPYLTLHATPVDAADRAFLAARVPHAQIVEWPVGHHFPQLAAPRRFARLLVG